MIRARARTGDDGFFQLTIEGHADPAVCAAVTAVQQSFLIWLDQLAELRPEDIHLTLEDITP